jgi:hypothetical protein
MFLPFIANPMAKIVKIVFVVFFSGVTKPPLKTELKAAWFAGLYLPKNDVNGIVALRTKNLEIRQFFMAKSIIIQVMNMKPVGTIPTLFTLGTPLLE